MSYNISCIKYKYNKLNITNLRSSLVFFFTDIWNLKHVDAKHVVFYYEVNPDSRESDPNPRGYHWHCENNNIVLQVGSS